MVATFSLFLYNKENNNLQKDGRSDDGKLYYNLACVDGVWYFLVNAEISSVKYDKDTLKPETCGQEKG